MSRSADLLTIEALATMASQMAYRLRIDPVANPEHDVTINEVRQMMIRAFDTLDSVDQDAGTIQPQDKPT